jgi:hypothetical protein
VQVELAVIAFNQRGAEGSKSRGEGGVSITFDALPAILEMQLNPYRDNNRVARAVSML